MHKKYGQSLESRNICKVRINSFHVNVPYLYPLKMSENRGKEMKFWREMCQKQQKKVLIGLKVHLL